jgi:hypothetical protein
MKPAFDEDRQKRIDDEVLVDTYNHLEVKGAWDSYLSDKIAFPFTAKVKVKDREGNENLIAVEVLGFEGRTSFRVRVCEPGSSQIFSESLLKLKEVKASFDTEQAINDWKYWRASGNTF